ncbi:MAG: flavin reductase family protein [Elusimicrobiota bacterium]
MTRKIPLPLSQVCGLLEPGPVVLVTTVLQGRPNVMTMSWHTMMDFEPPQVGCVIAGGSLTHAVLRETKECVINIPSVKLAKQVVGCGNASGRSVDKFKAFRLTAVPATRVKAPLVDECWANLECRLIDDSMAERYDFFVLEVVAAWIVAGRTRPKTLHHLGWGKFMVAGKTISLPSKMR